MQCQIKVATLKLIMPGISAMSEEKNADETQMQTTKELILKDGAVMMLMITSGIQIIREGRTGAMIGDGNMTGTETGTVKKTMSKAGEGINTGGMITSTTEEKVAVRAIEMRTAEEMITGAIEIAIRGMNKKIITGMIEEMSRGRTEEATQEVIEGEMIEERIERVIIEMTSNLVILERTVVDGRSQWGKSECGKVHLMQRHHHGKRM